MNRAELAVAIEKRDAAYEIKFVVPAATAEAILGWARNHLAPDPYAGSDDVDGYGVNSLYFDTSNLDVYHRKGSYGKCKYRIRRYGMEPNIYLERKFKVRGLVSKRRTRVTDDELLRLTTPEEDDAWVGYWFRRRLSLRQLHPRCQIRYRRVARVGMTAEGPIRLTIDRDVCAFTSKTYGVFEQGAWLPILPGQCILELKYRLATPSLFKALTDDLSLTPQAVSKYRLSIQAFGLVNHSQPAQGNGHAPLVTGSGPEMAEAATAPREV
jgi:hypothetical protein